MVDIKKTVKDIFDHIPDNIIGDFISAVRKESINRGLENSVRVISAVKLPQETLVKCAELVRADDQFTVHNEIDESLIAGVVIFYKDKKYDASLKSKLYNIERGIFNSFKQILQNGR